MHPKKFKKLYLLLIKFKINKIKFLIKGQIIKGIKERIKDYLGLQN